LLSSHHHLTYFFTNYYSMNRKLLLPLLGMLSTGTLNAQSIQVLSATVKDQHIPGAEVLLQRNGEQSQVTRTDAGGRATLSAGYADDASSLIIIKKPGYSTLVAKCPCDNLTYALSPVMENLDAMRVVLSWGDQPADIDAHLAYSGNHIYFRHKEGEGANLDVDDTDSYGPETVTIERRKEGQDYIYSVHDYSDREDPETRNLSRSGARVFVYVGSSLVRTYYVPENAQGNLWTVFRMSPDGQMYDVNRMSGIGDISYATLQSGMQNGRASAVRTLSGADRYNEQGEQYYHSGDFANAIRQYQLAIEANPGYGQAYSNLGLAYKKAGKYAEAIWANRKAIEFGNNVVKANSYYNIGRIYEERRQYANALRQYQLAKSNNANPAYDGAIQRMKGKR
jgi:hypothetical protein